MAPATIPTTPPTFPTPEAKAQPNRADAKVYMGMIVNSGDSYVLKSANEYSVRWRAKVFLKEGIELTYPWVEASRRLCLASQVVPSLLDHIIPPEGALNQRIVRHAHDPVKRRSEPGRCALYFRGLHSPTPEFPNTSRSSLTSAIASAPSLSQRTSSVPAGPGLWCRILTTIRCWRVPKTC